MAGMRVSCALGLLVVLCCASSRAVADETKGPGVIFTKAGIVCGPALLCVNDAECDVVPSGPINIYACRCQDGWTGTNCTVPAPKGLNLPNQIGAPVAAGTLRYQLFGPNGPNVLAIVLGTVAGVIFLLIVGGLGFFFYRRYKINRAPLKFVEFKRSDSIVAELARAQSMDRKDTFPQANQI